MVKLSRHARERLQQRFNVREDELDTVELLLGHPETSRLIHVNKQNGLEFIETDFDGKIIQAIVDRRTSLVITVHDPLFVSSDNEYSLEGRVSSLERRLDYMESCIKAMCDHLGIELVKEG